MPILNFPDPNEASDEGILALGGDLHPDSLRLAYSQGIFPWPIEGLPLAWFCPAERAILKFDELHVPRSLEREKKRTKLSFTVDQDFDSVIEACAETKRPGQRGTWITAPMLKAYKRFHREGGAHSVEAWDGDELVGGVYGVDCGGAFAAESMFFRKPYASKLALLHLIDHLEARGLGWIDIQVLTPHMEAMGARAIPRDEFLRLLRRTREQARGALFGPAASSGSRT